MSIPFSQSLRALRHDGTGFGRWLALIGVLLLGGWFTWFFRGDIPIYERSNNVTVHSNSEAEAVFRPAAAPQLQAGQSARLHLESSRPNQAAVLPATVTAVTSTSSDGAVRVQLALQQPTRLAGRLPPGQAGSVEIRVAHFTPAQLFFRAAGSPR